jgi:hypothetical protein
MPAETGGSPEQQSVKSIHRIRKAWQVTIRNWPRCPPSTHYAATQGRARYHAFLLASDVLTSFPISELLIWLFAGALGLMCQLSIIDGFRIVPALFGELTWNRRGPFGTRGKLPGYTHQK